MSTSTIWIVIAVVAAILLIAAFVVAIGRARSRRRQRRADEIREQARVATAKLERREALPQETAAKARAAQAEAEVKAAEAARLREQAAKHQSDAATSREQLQERWNRADSIDPKTGKQARETAGPTSAPGAARGEGSYEPTTDAGAVEAGNYREAGADHRSAAS